MTELSTEEIRDSLPEAFRALMWKEWQVALGRALSGGDHPFGEVLEAAKTATQADDRMALIGVLSMAYWDHLDDEEEEEFVEAMLEVARTDPWRRVGRAALSAAAGVETSDRIVDAIFEMLEGSKSALETNEILLMLADQEWDDEADAALDAFFEDASRPGLERSAIAVVWGRQKRTDKIPALIAALQSKDDDIVFYSASALAQMGRSEGIDFLESSAGPEASDPAVRGLLEAMRADLSDNS